MLTPWATHVIFNVTLYIPLAPALVLLGKFLMGCPLNWRRVPLIFLIAASSRALVLTLLPMNVLGYAVHHLAYLLCCAFGLGLRKWRLVIGFLTIMTCGMLMDITSMHLFLAFCRDEMIYLPEAVGPMQVLNPTVFPWFALAALMGMLIMVGVAALARPLVSRLSRLGAHGWLRAVRPIAVLVVVLLFVFRTLRKIDLTYDLHGLRYLSEVIRDQSLLLAMMVVLTFYMIQDFRTLRLSRQNQTLNQQRRMCDILLQDTRTFRHNIANMLYGFEGAVLSGNISEMQAYYHQMASKCARINNENAVALRHIPDPAVSALLLSKIQLAGALELPIYLNVEPVPRWKVLRSSDMCQVMGALLDNAIEAAMQSKTPHVAIDIGQVNGAVEIVIRNTYDEAQVDLSFLVSAGQSTKHGHEGLGLQSVRGVLARHDHAIMNQLQRGRYIETLLLFD